MGERYIHAYVKGGFFVLERGSHGEYTAFAEAGGSAGAKRLAEAMNRVEED